MLILFDHGTPAPLIPFIEGHIVRQAKEQGWDRVTNGDLLAAAERAGFHLLVTTDKNMRHQQNLAGRRVALIVLSNAQWPQLRPYVQRVVEAIHAATPGSYAEVDIPRLPRRSFKPEPFQP